MDDNVLTGVYLAYDLVTYEEWRYSFPEISKENEQ